jgi:uncharacterized protein involved in type VI secretion and phage assembly
MSEAGFDRLLEELDRRLYGKYRGKVVANNDAERRGRLEVQVPGVLGDTRLWALPCAPYAGKDVGFFAVPPVGAGVWIEFEAGRTDHPIWTGCYWAKGEIAAADAKPEVMFLRTPGATIRIEDAGNIEIETTGGAKISMSGTEIALEAPSIKNSANGGATALGASGFDAMNGALKVV